ncbi:MAG TPA: small-conductance mechanosensitive ion channel [Patescibacteria group bacterium]|nr:small-conductance mechanosensitive ion channel [Patescibacteria group bacterium]
METVENWGDAVMVSATEAMQNLLGFLPALIGAILILIIGWIIAGVLAGLIEKGLKAVGFEKAAQSTGIAGFIENAGSGWTASKLVAEIVKWFIRLIAIQAAASILGLTQISQVINAILLWLPNLVVAIVIIVIGALIANFVAGIVRGSAAEMGFSTPNLLANIARYAIIGFAAVAAFNQLGIAPTVVNTLFIGLVATLVLAFGLAFGLGGQQTAAQITQGWYEKGRQTTPRIAEKVKQAEAEQEGASPTAASPAGPAASPAGPATSASPATEPSRPTEPR